jgi:tryptophan halogenase
MRKLAIIGKGTAGAFTANHFNYYCKDDFEIEVYYDSAIKEQAVGEGTTVDIPQALHTTVGLEFHDIMQKVNGNFKTGIHYIGWGKQDYMHTFPMPNVSIHFNAVMLQELIMEHNKKNGVKYIDKNIKDNDIDADYVINCTGAPKTNQEMYKAKYIPVDSAVVMQSKWDTPRYFHTLCIAHEYGWIFGIPLQDRISFGYIYNSSFTNKKKIKELLLGVMDDYECFWDIDTEPNYIKFKNYYRKENYTDKVAYNGNASFFLEPMEATSIGTIDTINRNLYDFLYGNNSLDNVNNRYSSWFKECQDVITMHYMAGSQLYHNDFWQYATRLGNECYADKGQLLSDILNNYNKLGFNTVKDYGTWTMESFNQNIKGLGLENVIQPKT